MHMLVIFQSNEFEKKLLDVLEEPDRPKINMDESELFATSIAHKLRRLDPYQLSLAQSKIIQVLSEIEFGSLHPSYRSTESGSSSAANNEQNIICPTTGSIIRPL